MQIVVVFLVMFCWLLAVSFIIWYTNLENGGRLDKMKQSELLRLIYDTIKNEYQPHIELNHPYLNNKEVPDSTLALLFIMSCVLFSLLWPLL